MLRKTLLVGIPLAVLALAAAIVLPPRFAHGSPIRTKAVGVWQETDSLQAYRLSIVSDPGRAYGVWYAVTYPRSFKVPFPASLEDDTITIWGENTMSAPVWRVTYDEAGDTLTVTRPNGAETHTLKRVSGQDAQVPKWLLKQARFMARQGKATQAWWTKTTLELALRAVEPGHWQKPSAKNSRPTYLLVMRGAFTPRSIRAGATPAPVAWGFEVIDPNTHWVDESGGTNSSPTIGKLDLHEIEL
jgi:YD repeat-containing protein